MTRSRSLHAVLLLLLLPGASIAQQPKVRASLDLKGDCWVGQSVTLVVELFAPGYFSGAASFDLPDPPDMLLIPPHGSPLVSSEQIDNVSYTVQRHELTVLSRSAGEQKIPAITARFQFKRQPLDKDTVPATVTTAPLSLTAKTPPGAEKLGSILCARELKAVEEWKPQPGQAKAGDAFTRTITFTAPDVPAMAFPVFPTARIDGLGVYPKPPEVLDHSERGRSRGQRRDATTYVCERPGTYVIPAARLSWFDLDSNKIQTIDFPAHTLQVAPNPAMVSNKPPASESIVNTNSTWRFVGIIMGVLAVVAAAIFLLRRQIKRWFAQFYPIHLAPLNPVQSKEV